MRLLSDAKFNVIGTEAGYNADNASLIVNSTNAGNL
jgi:hypothetical protein